MRRLPAVIAILLLSPAAWAGPPAGKGPAAKKNPPAAASERASDRKTDQKEKGARRDVCHVSDEGVQKTLRLPEPAVRAHLGHGDTEGACGGSSDEGSTVDRSKR